MNTENPTIKKKDHHRMVQRTPGRIPGTCAGESVFVGHQLENPVTIVGAQAIRQIADRIHELTEQRIEEPTVNSNHPVIKDSDAEIEWMRQAGWVPIGYSLGRYCYEQIINGRIARCWYEGAFGANIVGHLFSDPSVRVSGETPEDVRQALVNAYIAGGAGASGS